MKLLKNILFFGITLAAIGCAKPDNESPGDVVPKSITDEPFRFNPSEGLDVMDEEDIPAPIFINDDEDDETGPSNQSK
jgi:hypothetical protein